MTGQEFWGRAPGFWHKEAFIAEFDAAIAKTRAEEREMLLADIYLYRDQKAYVAVAALCDEKLDRTGKLLGKVRDRVDAIRGRTP